MIACASCRVRFAATMLRGGMCSECLSMEEAGGGHGAKHWRIARALNGQREAVRMTAIGGEAIGVDPSFVAAVASEVRRSKRFSADSGAADLRWLWNESGMSYATVSTSTVTKDIASNAQADVDAPHARVFVQKTVGDFVPTDAVMASAGKVNRIMSTLSMLSHHTIRILQRRFAPGRFPKQGGYFGEWAGLVDYIYGDAAHVDMKKGKRLPQRQVDAWISHASRAADVALAEYVSASRDDAAGRRVGRTMRTLRGGR